MVGVVLALTVIVVVPTALALTWLGPLASAAVRIRSFALLLGFTMLGPAFLLPLGTLRHDPATGATAANNWRPSQAWTSTSIRPPSIVIRL